jgi:hypothetical protein
MRSIVRSSSREAEDILFSYMSMNYSTFVVIDKQSKKFMPESMGVSYEGEELSRNLREVYGRIEKGDEVGRVTVYINQAKLTKFCNTRDFGYSDFKRQIEAKYPVKVCNKLLTAGVKAAAPVSAKCLRISLPESEFEAVAAVPVVEA